jgi:hypothetical protein
VGTGGLTYEGTGRANFSTMSKGLEPPSLIKVSRRASTVCWMRGRVESMCSLVKRDSTMLLSSHISSLHGKVGIFIPLLHVLWWILGKVSTPAFILLELVFSHTISTNVGLFLATALPPALNSGKPGRVLSCPHFSYCSKF